MLANLLGSLRFVVRHPLNRGRFLAAVVRCAAWQLASRLAPGAIAVDWVGGTRLLARRGDTGITGNIYCGLCDYEEMAFVLHVLRPDDRFADVGANAGVWTVLACGAAGAGGWAFEPAPATHCRLADNVRLNALETRVQLLAAAVGDRRGTVRFTGGLDCVNHVAADGEPSAAREVPLVTLDETFGDDAPTVMKVDVEGFETAVLRGAGRCLADRRLQGIIIELIGCGTRYGYDEAAIPRLLASHGFRACRYDPAERRLTPREQLAPGNLLFVRDMDWTAARLRGAAPFEVFGRRI